MDPLIASAALRTVLALKQQLDTAVMKRAITETQLGLQQVKDRTDDDVLKTLGLGFVHLAAALDGPAGPQMRHGALANARGKFTDLTILGVPHLYDPGRLGLSREEIHALARLGMFYYYLAVEDDGSEKYALAEANECTARFPELAARLFPVELYSRDYRAELSRFVVPRPKNDPEYRRQRRAYLNAYAKIGGRTTVAAVATLGAGLVGGTIAAVTGGAAGALPISWASRTWHAINDWDILEPLPPAETQLAVRDPRLVTLLDELASEARDRYQAVMGRQLTALT